ncbi:MAG TPA: hypothetical protein VJU14_01265 [Solirubrobacterales bacterium]|nr:hypothetical protein [Solirubrobacterales bacterium]
MTPRALVLSYSQSGQTTAAAEALVGPLESKGWTVDRRTLATVEAYPFPWGLRSFLDAFPETVTGRPPPLQPLAIDGDGHPDLVILASQVWYLAPSLPVQAFLDSEQSSVLSGRPVVSVVTCRNMWYAAVTRLEEKLRSAGATLLGTVVLTDKSPRWTTFVMTPRLFLTGKRGGLWGIVPAPGIGAEELDRAARIGELLAAGLEPIRCQGGPAPAVEVVPENLVLDNFASRAFPIFARPILALDHVGGRHARAGGLWAFAVCLVIGVIVALPVLSLARLLLGGRMQATAERFLHRLEAGRGK